MAQQPTPELANDLKLNELTPREREVLELIARGLSNREIADTLVVQDNDREIPCQADPDVA